MKTKHWGRRILMLATVIIGLLSLQACVVRPVAEPGPDGPLPPAKPVPAVVVPVPVPVRVIIPGLALQPLPPLRPRPE